MKKFIHKKLWIIAEWEYVPWYKESKLLYLITKWDDKYYTFPELIEWCSEREEVIEKDWIYTAFNEYYGNEKGIMENEYLRTDFRKVIEKHTPKEKKFTYTDISNFAVSKWKDYDQEVVIRWTLEIFLKENNLLAEEQQVKFNKWNGWNIAGITNCQHESNWQVYTSNPPQYKCKKCWEFFTA